MLSINISAQSRTQINKEEETKNRLHRHKFWYLGSALFSRFFLVLVPSRLLNFLSLESSFLSSRSVVFSIIFLVAGFILLSFLSFCFNAASDIKQNEVPFNNKLTLEATKFFFLFVVASHNRLNCLAFLSLFHFIKGCCSASFRLGCAFLSKAIYERNKRIKLVVKSIYLLSQDPTTSRFHKAIIAGKGSFVIRKSSDADGGRPLTKRHFEFKLLLIGLGFKLNKLWSERFFVTSTNYIKIPIDVRPFFAVPRY